MVVYHDLDITENLAVSPMGFLAGLSEVGHALPVDGAMGLGVQHEGHGEQPLDPFWVELAMF